jgi:hypothetical protein
MKMVIISMPKMILTKVVESTILGEEETHVKKKNVAKCHQIDFDIDESNDFNDDEQHENKAKKKDIKVNLDTYRR